MYGACSLAQFQQAWTFDTNMVIVGIFSFIPLVSMQMFLVILSCI